MCIHSPIKYWPMLGVGGYNRGPVKWLAGLHNPALLILPLNKLTKVIDIQFLKFSEYSNLIKIRSFMLPYLICRWEPQLMLLKETIFGKNAWPVDFKWKLRFPFSTSVEEGQGTGCQWKAKYFQISLINFTMPYTMTFNLDEWP